MEINQAAGGNGPGREEPAKLPFRIEVRRRTRDASPVLIAATSLYVAALDAFHATVRTMPEYHITLSESDRVLARFPSAPIAASYDPAVSAVEWDRQCPKVSARETEVLRHLLRGRSMKETARLLNITPRTVAFHKYRVMEANGLKSNAELISFAARCGLLPLADVDQVARE